MNDTKLTITQGDEKSYNLTFGQVGKRFATGIGIACTAAAAATDTGVSVVGIQINATYI